MVQNIQKPDHSKTGYFCPDFKWWSENGTEKACLLSKISGIQILRQVTWLYHLNTRQPYCPVFRWIRYSGVRYLDGYCIFEYFGCVVYLFGWLPCLSWVFGQLQTGLAIVIRVRMIIIYQYWGSPRLRLHQLDICLENESRVRTPICRNLLNINLHCSTWLKVFGLLFGSKSLPRTRYWPWTLRSTFAPGIPETCSREPAPPSKSSGTSPSPIRRIN